MARLRGPRRINLYWLVALMTLIALPAIAAPQFPALTGRVVDEAGLLSPAARERITGWLAQFEAATKRQVVVVTVKSLQGLPIEDYGYQLGRFWGIGEKDKNTGAILLVAPTEHKVRIEVGYGLEGELTDAISSTIINQDILPAFREGKYEAGTIAGTAAILQALGWNGAASAIPPPPRPSSIRARGSPWAFLPFLSFFVMLWFFIWRLSRHGARPGGGGMGMLGFGLGALAGSGTRFGGGGGGFSGGFSGGGGSFGGGGSSGSW
jgi:uncharacterized protein